MDSKVVRIDSEVLRGSKTLQWMVVRYRERKLKTKEDEDTSSELDENANNRKIRTNDTLDQCKCSVNDETTEENLSDLIEFRRKETIDLTQLGVSVGVSAEVLGLIENFMKMHLREVWSLYLTVLYILNFDATFNVYAMQFFTV